MLLKEHYHMCPEFRCLVHDLNSMSAIRSQSNAFEHIDAVCWSLCGWNTAFCLIILHEERANKSADVHTYVGRMPLICVSVTSLQNDFSLSLDHAWVNVAAIRIDFSLGIN